MALYFQRTVRIFRESHSGNDQLCNPHFSENTSVCLVIVFKYLVD